MKPNPSSPGTDFTERREAARESVLRTNRAVMIILAVVLMLGLGLVALSFRAHQSQRRAESAETAATERLWSSYLAQARAERLTAEAGHRAAALAAISNAAAIRPSTELRDEALASFGLRDLIREVSWPLQPGAYGFYFDPSLEHYVVRYALDELSMFRLADNTLVRVFRAADAGLPTNSVVKEFNFSLTGRYVAVQYTTGDIVLWERDTGRPAHLFGRGEGNERLGWRATFSGDDRTFCARSASRTNRIVFIDLTSGTRREVEVPGVNDTVRLNHPGTILAWYRGNDLILNDARTGAHQKTIPWPAEVMSCRWDWRGERISVWCRDGTLNVIDVRSGRIHQMGGRFVGPWVQQFSPDGTMLATAGHDGTSRLWDVNEARLLAQTREARSFTFGRDGERIAFAIPGQLVGVWRISKPGGYRRVQGIGGDTATVWFQDVSPDGRWAVWTAPQWINRPGFELFDLTSNRPGLFVPTNRTVRVGFHPLEPKLIVASRDGLRSFQITNASDGRIRLDPAETIPVPEGFQPRNFSFSGNGRRLALVSAGKVVVAHLDQPGRFVELEGTLITSELAGPASVTGSGGLAISKDGRWVVAGNEASGRGPALWDTETGRMVRRFDSETANVAFSPDGRWLVGVGTGFCTVWNTATWEQQWQRPRTPMLTTHGAAAFTADGSLMAFSPSVDEIELAVPGTGDHIATISGSHIVAVTGLRLSADGRSLAAPSSDGHIHLWDLSFLRGELAKMGLDWGSRGALLASVATAEGARRGWSATPAWFAGIGLGTVALAGLLGMLVLRRHGRLTRDFVRTTELAAQQARELVVERDLNELKSRFVAMVSHEFRTPLGITMSAIELLRNHLDMLDNAKRQELFNDIFSSTRQMAALMEQVLVLGRVEGGRVAVRPVATNLEGLCQRLVDESLSAANRRCPIHVKVEGDLAGARADESLVRHILSNLLSNAVKYSAVDQAVEFVIRRDGSGAVFTVQDRGIGIAEADLPRLFQAFHRASNVGDIPGTGLGLVIVKRCVDLYEGSIEVHSRQNEGTTFTVKLPLFG